MQIPVIGGDTILHPQVSEGRGSILGIGQLTSGTLGQDASVAQHLIRNLFLLRQQLLADQCFVRFIHGIMSLTLHALTFSAALAQLSAHLED